MCRRTIHLVLCCLTLLFFGCPSRESKIIDVGVVLPLTGPVAEPGNKALKGLKLAIDQFNNSSKSYQVRLLVEDSQSDPKAGVSAANKLISVSKVKVIIGDLMSSVAMAVAPITERNKVILFAPGASNPKFPDLGDYVFRNWASDDYDGKVMAEYLHDELNKTMAAVVYVNNDYGVGLASAFSDHFRKLGSEVLVYESYPQGTLDFRSIIAKVRAKKQIDILYLPGQPMENGHLVKQLAEMGVKLPIAANLSVESPDFLRIVGENVGGIVFTTPVYRPEISNQSGVSFQSEYVRAFGSDPDVVAGHAYDAGNILIEALRACEFDLAKLRDSLAGVKDYPGVTGTTSFLPNGDVKKDVYIRRMNKLGESTLIKTFSPK